MKQYVIIYEHTGDSWSAYIPDLPGCVSAGVSREEVAKLIREAVKFHIEGMREEGLAIPECRCREGINVAA